MGGYFGLELPSGAGEYYSGAYSYQSGRAAFLALLQTHRPRLVWMPWYICDSMLEPLYMAGVEIARYSIDDALNIKGDITLQKGQWLLYVNYFGLCDAQVESVLARFPRERIVIDSSQAFFSPPRACLANIYSPRKYFGVPDGGYLMTDLSMSVPDKEDEGSVGRSSHLIKRLAGEPESGYADFGQAEAGLSGQKPSRMSQLTRRLLESVDYGSVLLRRKDNFAILHDRLGEFNRFPFSGKSNAPLCYPFVGATSALRQRLIEKRIFMPTYWPGVSHENHDAQMLAQNILPLPCDQRYCMADMNRLADVFLEIWGEYRVAESGGLC